MSVSLHAPDTFSRAVTTTFWVGYYVWVQGSRFCQVWLEDSTIPYEVEWMLSGENGSAVLEQVSAGSPPAWMTLGPDDLLRIRVRRTDGVVNDVMGQFAVTGRGE
uniref:Uncharacterized protein n=1 Tax=viral metagenome TaxID=1070528 RepID=A0A6M3L0G6_9ZZZZ